MEDEVENELGGTSWASKLMTGTAGCSLGASCSSGFLEKGPRSKGEPEGRSRSPRGASPKAPSPREGALVLLLPEGPPRGALALTEGDKDGVQSLPPNVR